MILRAITGIFFVAALIGAILLGKYSFTAFFTLLGIGCLYEFYNMIGRVPDVRPLVWPGLWTAAVLGASVALYSLGMIPLSMVWLFLPGISLIFILPLYRQRPKPFHDIVFTLGGLWYAAFPFFFFVALGFVRGEYNTALPLGFLVILWANDTGAYLAGRSFGRNKLFERISPNKTWEGFVGGFLLALAIALNLEKYLGELQMWQWSVMALIISCFGTWGDLVESMLKRHLGVKDSGKILPGHGGLLDRFDGLLVSVPLVFLFLLFL